MQWGGRTSQLALRVLARGYGTLRVLERHMGPVKVNWVRWNRWL